MMLLTCQLSQRSKYHPRLEIALEQVVLVVKIVVKVLVRVVKASRHAGSCVNSVVGRLLVVVGSVLGVMIVFLNNLAKMIMI